MRALILLAALVPIGLPAAPYLPAMTGERFVRDIMAMPDGNLASMRRDRAMGYMDGVMDGTVGVRWCPPGQQAAHEISYVAAEQMQRLPAEKLRGNAAALALAVVSKIYPCTAQGAKS